MARYIYQRGKAFWCRYPVPGFHFTGYPLEVYTTGSATDVKRCYALCENILAKIRVWTAEGKKFRIESGTLIEIIEEKPTKAPAHRPTYYELFCRYWLYHLRAKKTAHALFSDIKPSLIRFGARYYDEVDRSDLEKWRGEMLTAGFSNALIRNRIQYIKAIYNYGMKEMRLENRINYNPCQKYQLKSGDERKFCLTPEKFERNYAFFKTGNGKDYQGNPDFAFFYLGAWECFRRPEEVAGYRLEYLDWDTHIINVPSDIAKTKKDDSYPLTDRLWLEIAARYKQGDTGLIFKNQNGTPWLYHSSGLKHTLTNNTKRHMKRLRGTFGKDAGWFRDTRGGGITAMFRLGIDAKVVMGLSGHHDIRSLMRYNKNFLERMKEANVLRGNSTGPAPISENVIEWRAKKSA